MNRINWVFVSQVIVLSTSSSSYVGQIGENSKANLGLLIEIFS